MKGKKLGDAELDIMKAIWQSDKPLTANEILAVIQGHRKWPLSTLMTSLNRLAEKGFVSCDRTFRYNLYSALVNENDYKAQEGQAFLTKLYGNSVSGFVSNLYDNRAIDEKDLDGLRKFLDALEKGSNDG